MTNEFIHHHSPLLFLAGLSNPPTVGITEQEEEDSILALKDSLRNILAPKRLYQIWDNSRGVNAEFNVVLVNKDIKFPPLKSRPTAPGPLHSPISPLSPSSPLYPDGIIAPIWIRKHREMVPSVFLLVLSLYSAASIKDPLIESSSSEELERLMDATLVKEIAERKRSTIERGIKLAVILLCDRQLLDDPTLDSRLSLIRRQSGLDSRASLFVISPVPQGEVFNFVASLKTELYPAALDYFREHGRRVRRKRGRAPPKGGLSDKGWSVRYDYKLGFFAEMRSEIEVSLKHYEDSYDTLVEMFGNSALLVPRTKRWAEAKVLADCLTLKICKMYLYVNEPSRCSAQLNRHVSRFRNLSNVWGIGEQTFEYWSWLSKQYRLFGELVSIAIRAGFRLPSLKPPAPPRPMPAGTPQPPPPGLVPANVLHHAGYYFYLSGACAVERRNRFRSVLSNDSSGASPASVAQESKVDHAELIIDLYTRAYEEFKVHKTSRMSLFIASQIALAHYEGGNYAMALKFHERIARTYRRESWNGILGSILQLSLDSAAKLGDYESVIKYLIELMAPSSPISLEQRSAYANDLVKVLQTQKPTVPNTILSIDSSEIAALYGCRITFWDSATTIDESVPFQLSIASTASSRSSNLSFAKLVLTFNNNTAPIVITGRSSTPNDASSLYRLEGEKHSAPLSWDNGSMKVFQGIIASNSVLQLTVSTVVLTLIENDWTIDLILRPELALPSPMSSWYTESLGQLVAHHLLQVDPSKCDVRVRELNLVVDVIYTAPAYLDEEFAISVSVVNNDALEIDTVLDILLQPGADDSPNRITIDDQTTSSFIKAVPLGLLSPSSSLIKTFRLHCAGSPGSRQIDLAIRCQASTLSDDDSTARTTTPFELLKTLTILATLPFHCAFNTRTYQRRRPLQPLLDLREPTGWEGATDVVVVANLTALGPSPLEIIGIKLVCDPSYRSIRMIESSLEKGSNTFPTVWKAGDSYNAIFRFDVAPPSSLPLPLEASSIEVSWRRPNDTIQSKTIHFLPPLTPVPLVPSARLSLPPFLVRHKPTDLVYHISNPTDRLIILSTSVEGSDGFVFAGARKFPTLVLAPQEERRLVMTVISLGLGECMVPRLRVFEQEQGEEGEIRLREWEVGSETAEVVVESEQRRLEIELGNARGEESVESQRTRRTFVLP